MNEYGIGTSSHHILCIFSSSTSSHHFFASPPVVGTFFVFLSPPHVRREEASLPVFDPQKSTRVPDKVPNTLHFIEV